LFIFEGVNHIKRNILCAKQVLNCVLNALFGMPLLFIKLSIFACICGSKGGTGATNGARLCA
jgi:hypothetical protein